jgi:protease-4
MALEVDALIDRARLKRRLTFWRVLAVLALVVAAIVAVPRGGGKFSVGPLGHHIARYSIDGLIGDGNEQVEALDKLSQDPSVAAVVLHLDTPGGAVGGGEGIHDAVLALAQKKPVVAVMDSMAASAGYMIAVAAPHIVARESTLTGSIGVLLEFGDVSGLLDKIGVKAEQLASGPLKGQPSFTQPLSAQGRDYLQGLVMDLYDQFVQIVALGRHMDPAKVKSLADGRAFTGRQAHDLGLVDEIGGEPEALAWLRTARHVESGLPVEDTKKGTWLQRQMESSLNAIFISASRALHVDGVWAVWQPSMTRD